MTVGVLIEAPLAPPARGWFTGRDPGATPTPIGGAGNLAHRRPHRPADLAAARVRVAAATATDAAAWHLMEQVHGAEVAVVDAATPVGAELRGVDACVTSQAGRPLAVQAADCVPVLLAGPGAVGVAHAGRVGFLAGVLPAAVRALAELVAGTDPGPGPGPGSGPGSGRGLTAVIGPAIGPCCYEVPAELRAVAADQVPVLAATTDWGTPSLDLPGGARAQLDAAGVEVLGGPAPCTRCDGSFFSHRRDPASGRQVGLVVLDPGAAA